MDDLPQNNQKPFLSSLTAKIILALIVFAGSTIIIISGAKFIVEYYKTPSNNKIIKQVNQMEQEVNQIEQVEQIEREKNQIETPNLLFKASTTDDWQTYWSEEFGFEVKYPRDWKAIEDKNGNVFFFDNPFYANEYKLSEGPEFEDKYRDYAFISISRYLEGAWTAAGTVTKNTEIKDFVYKLYHPKDYSKDNFISEETIIGGQKAYIFGHIPTVFFKQKNDIVTISKWSGPEYTNYKKLTATFHQILSTFKFID